MSLLDAMKARHQGQTEVGREVARDLQSMTDDEYTSAAEAAYFAKHGVPMSSDKPATMQVQSTGGAQRIAESVGEGMARSVWELGRTVRNVADFYVQNAPTLTAADIEMGNVTPDDIVPADWNVKDFGPMPDWVENKNFTEAMAAGSAEFMVPFLAFNKVLAGARLFDAIGAKTMPWVGRAASAAAASIPVDFAFMDPIDNNLVQMAKSFGWESEWTQFLEADMDNEQDAATALENRARAAIANMPVGVATDALIAGGAGAVRMAGEVSKRLRNVQWTQLEETGMRELKAALPRPGTMNDVTSVPEAAAKQAAAVAKIVAGRVGRLTVAARKKFNKTGELAGMDELADGLVAQGADPMAVRQGIDQGLADHALPDEHTMDVTKREGGRAVLQKVALPPEVKATIESKAASPRAAANAMSRVRETMARYPARDGWVEIKPADVEMDPKTGDVKKITWAAANEGEGRFTFHLDPKTRKADKATADARKDALAARIVQEVRDTERRAATGDRNAQVIQRQRYWYSSMRQRLREEFGGAGQVFAELLGATSPNTAVPQNWDNAVEALRGMLRGDYDQQLAKLETYLAEGKPMDKFPADDKIKKATGKLFGMNSGGAMQAMLDMWKAIEPGSAPKAKNFAGNLIGTSDEATIDVWAARMLQRVAGEKRLPALLEAAVPGNWNTKATEVTGPYGFGADVMKRAATQLGMDPHELQAYTWFAEKERWAAEHWTTADGEGGSFEQMADSAGLSRFQAGVSVQQADAPSDEVVAAAAKQIQASLKPDRNVIDYRALPTKGMYAGSTERAFDMEITARPEWKPHSWVADLARVAKENNQYDVLVSKVLKADEPSNNARPGVEVYFRDQKALDEIMPMIESITAKGQDGFTFVVDPRMRMKTPDGAEAGKYVGLRLQFVPEISMRWDEGLRQQLYDNPDMMRELVAAKTDAMLDLVNELQKADGVLTAHQFHYDSFVMGKENYDEYISGANSGGAGAREGTPWFGRSYRENIAAAARRLGVDESAGAVPQPGNPQGGAGEAVTGIPASLQASLDAGDLTIEVAERDASGRAKAFKVKRAK